MPAEDRATRSGERCDLHPGSASVGRCSGCGRPLCLACAVPVRGSVLGAECLTDVLGPDAATPSPPPEPPGRAVSAFVGVAFAIAVVASALPWTRFRAGSGVFGAWGGFRWSTLAAVAAVVGLAGWWFLRARLPGSARSRALTLAAIGTVSAVAALLAIVDPPRYARPSTAPWLALGAGLATVAVCFRDARPAWGARDRLVDSS